MMEKLLRGAEHVFGSVAALTAARVELPNRVFVGTHHKTGTVWMYRVFRQVCRDTHLRLDHGHGARCHDACDVFLSYDSRCSWEDSVRSWKGVHLIRDPRDVIVSAAFYHATSSEPWLHEKVRAFGGLTYSEKINSYACLEDRIAFEMEHDSHRTVAEIVAWDYADPRFHEARYETLLEDHDLLRFHEIFTFLGFPGGAIPTCLRAAHRNSLFSGRVARSGHVRSGRPQQWREHLTPMLRKRFTAIFGDALIRLGYERDDAWIDTGGAAPPASP